MHLRRDTLERILARAERVIALLDRCRPLNGQRERERLLAVWQNGHKSSPAWIFARPANLSDVRTALALVAEHGANAGAWGKLYAERALELECEAAAAELIGQAGFREQAERRYPVDRGLDGTDAEACARRWVSERAEPKPDERRVQSDDPSDPDSLISALQRAVGEQRLPFRVLASPELPCAAATGDGVLIVRMGLMLGVSEVQRIVLHEIEAHALPRSRARGERLGLFRLGTARGSDDEEGRALLLEERHGFLDARRRAELGRRHLASLAVRDGASFVETVELLLEHASALPDAIDVALRAHRGGGLGREIVYLTAQNRVRRALAAEPELESWMCRGRVSVDAARVLSGLGDAPDLFDARSAA